MAKKEEGEARPGYVEQEGGVLDIDESVFATIAFREAGEVDGLVAIHGTFIAEILSRIKGGETPSGIRIEKAGDEISVTITVSVRYGTNLSEFAQQVRSRIKNGIESMTPYRVRSVNVLVDALVAEPPAPPEPEIEGESS